MTENTPAQTPLVGIIMGSKSDLSVMEGCAAELERLGVPYELVVASAHRNPAKVHEWAESAADRGIRVIVAAAGKAAHLGGVVAAFTPLPVIGVPVALKHLEGMDSLLSIVQMPAGVPVATVSINGARNAGLLALRILGSGTDAFAQQVHADLRQFSQNLRQTAMDKGAALRTRVAEAKAKAAAEREAEESSSAPRPIPAPEASSEPQAYVP